ncbi:hypothetical protein ECG_03575 [Echinococcus granulosus]|uniref:Uncharacterized protein n=1 Tax=Echinococcus granulosus TaxID=6210 RepID=A0A068WYA9_ECHGR|nr:hypothetical protein ECG_03575 [Echinococcus granulosus]CDS23466.1 hypothetical protein EgrG_002041800 [Echinococcus granulosus]
MSPKEGDSCRRTKRAKNAEQRGCQKTVDDIQSNSTLPTTKEKGSIVIPSPCLEMIEAIGVTVGKVDDDAQEIDYVDTSSIPSVWPLRSRCRLAGSYNLACMGSKKLYGFVELITEKLDASLESRTSETLKTFIDRTSSAPTWFNTAQRATLVKATGKPDPKGQLT